MILQSKVPLGSYIGLKKTNKEGVIRGNINIFDAKTGNFVLRSIQDISSESEKITAFLVDLLHKK